MNSIERIQQKQAVVGVVGLGYVGLPLVLAYARAGYQRVCDTLAAPRQPLL